MVGLDGRVKLLDFGLAKARTQLSKTQPGYVKGKFGYLAPEQLGGDVDGRADVFALGLCLYEGLAGRQVFSQETAAETVIAITEYQGAPPVGVDRPDVWPELEGVAAQATHPHPVLRFRSAGEMKSAVERVLAGRSIVANADRVAAAVRELFPERKPLAQRPVEPPPDLPEGAEPLGLEELTEALDRERRRRRIFFALATLLVLGAIGWGVYRFVS